MSLYAVITTSPGSVIYFSIPVVIWVLCFAYAHFSFDPGQAAANRDKPTRVHEHIAMGIVPWLLGSWIVLAMFRDILLRAIS